jgi:hypothetical protein
MTELVSAKVMILILPNYIESDEDNKGFKMNVVHEGFHDGWDTNRTSDWIIDEDITFYDPNDDLDY